MAIQNLQQDKEKENKIVNKGAVNLSFFISYKIVILTLIKRES